MANARARTESRFRAAIAVDLVWGRRVHPGVTEDVSFGGMFLRTKARPPAGQLVLVHATVPGQDVAVPMHAFVAHVADKRSSRGAREGIGLQFYGISDAQRTAWVRYVSELRRQAGDSVGASPARTKARPGALAGDYAAVLEIVPGTTSELLRMYARDVSLNGTFIETNKRLEPGDEIYLVVHHPDNDRLFGIRAAVRRKVRQQDVTGIGVEFVGMDAARRRAFWKFIGVDGDEAEAPSCKIVMNPDDLAYPRARRQRHVTGSVA